NLMEHWNHYMTAVGNSARPLGQAVLAHMRLYFAWRFQRINGYRAGNMIPDAAGIRQQEQGDSGRKAQMARELAGLRQKADLARLRASAANSVYLGMRSSSAYPPPSREQIEAARMRVEEAKGAEAQAEHEFNAYQARWAGVPEPSLDNMYIYDRRLVAEA